MPTGRKKKRSVVEASSLALLALIRLAMEADQESSGACQVWRICRTTGGGHANSSHRPGALQEIFWRYFTQPVIGTELFRNILGFMARLMKILTMAVPGLNNNVNLIDLKLDNLNINKNTLNNFIFRIFLLGPLTVTFISFFFCNLNKKCL